MTHPVGHINTIRGLTCDSVASGTMFFALLYAIVRRLLRFGVVSSDAGAEMLVLRHELAVLRRQIKRPQLRRRDKLFLAALGTLVSR